MTLHKLTSACGSSIIDAQLPLHSTTIKTNIPSTLSAYTWIDLDQTLKPPKHFVPKVSKIQDSADTWIGSNIKATQTFHT